jgi:hypothetical protein
MSSFCRAELSRVKKDRHCYIVVPKMSSKHNIVTILYELSTICLMLAEIHLLLNKCYCQALRSDVGKKKGLPSYSNNLSTGMKLSIRNQ